MTALGWYLVPWKKYAVFSGRARRKEYWMFFLGNAIVLGITLLAIGAISVHRMFVYQMDVWGLNGATIRVEADLLNLSYFGWAEALLVFFWLYCAAIFVPSLAVGVRRFHDTGRSGWYYGLGLIPYVGIIILVVFFATEGEAGDNHFGPDPKVTGPLFREAFPEAPYAEDSTHQWPAYHGHCAPTVVPFKTDAPGTKASKSDASKADFSKNNVIFD